MNIFNAISLFGGLAMFLYGMRVMGNALRESSSGTLKTAMEKATSSLFKSFLMGLLVTALIQSSTATIVITSGLVAAGLIPLKQTVGIIIGANVGTTVTGQIIRLLDIGDSSAAFLQFFKPATLAPIAMIVAIIILMTTKNKRTEQFGRILAGFGVLFYGLINMTDAVSSLADSAAFLSLFSNLEKSPVLGYFSGALVALVLQSSSATIGILQAFATTGHLTFHGIYAVLVGIYLGDCLTTALVCAIGQKGDARRVGVIHVLFNISETVLVLIGVTILHKAGLLDSIWDKTINSGGIANTNTIYNLASAILLFPVAMQFETLSRIIVRDKKTEEFKYERQLSELNPNFYRTPAIAFNSCHDAMITMLNAATENIHKACNLFRHYDEKVFNEVMAEEENIDLFADRISQYLAGVAPYIREELHTGIMTQYYRDVAEFERLGDHALNIAEEAKKMADGDLEISAAAQRETLILEEVIDRILEDTQSAFMRRNGAAAAHIEPLEEVVDDLVDALEKSHLQRMGRGECSSLTGSVYLNYLSDMERISDICSNIGFSVLARIHPELQENEHNYMSGLHMGRDEDFNNQYAEARDKYFARLKSVSGDAVPAGVKSETTSEED